MALRDPGMIEFSLMISTEELATAFARENGLLLSNDQLLVQNNRRTCALGTPECRGTVNEATKHQARRNKTYQGFRCSGCKRFRSAKNVLCFYDEKIKKKFFENLGKS